MSDKHPNIDLLVKRMDAALERGDYPEVLHASASVFETLAKHIVGTESIQNQTLKSFFERYRKESVLPQEILDYIRGVYDLRNVTPLAGHGSTQTASVSKESAVAVCELTKAFVAMEYRLRATDAPVPDPQQPSSAAIPLSLRINSEGKLSGERKEWLALFSEALYATRNQEEVAFDVRLEKLDTINNAITSLVSSSEPADRITRVRLLELADSHQDKIGLFVAAARLAFKKPVRDWLTSGYELLEVMEGLTARLFEPDSASASTGWHSIDIYRKSEPRLTARIRVSQQEADLLVSTLDLVDLAQLVDWGGYIFFDLPPEIRYKKGLAAVLHRVVWEQGRKPESDLEVEKVLDLWSWHIGLA